MGINIRAFLGKQAHNGVRPQLVLSPSMQLTFIILQAVNLLTLVNELALWFIALASLCLILHLAIYLKLVKRLSRASKVFIAVSGCVLLVISGKNLGLLLGMLHLLAFSYLLKPFELNQRKDFYQLVILSLFVLSTAFLFQQSIYFALLLIALLIINLAWLVAFFTKTQSRQYQIRFAGKLLLQSVPLAVMLFIIFPKIPPFWKMPVANSAKTGLQDHVKIGDISNLALSNELAFRVEFSRQTSQQTMAYRQLYWRALVLTDFDGQQWFRAKHAPIVNKQYAKHELTLDNKTRSLSYQVILEPNYQHWLYGLDLATLSNNDTSGRMTEQLMQLSDYSLYSQNIINQPLSYQVVSYLDRALDFKEPSLDYYTRIDRQSNPRLRQFAERLTLQYQDDSAAKINAVLNHFRQQNYRYTLTPPPLMGNSLDEFFFSTQAGFCEHYASSFTFLMRALGIPARVVLGYLGGEYNQQGRYYSVYQSDAHAWSEVWLEGKGWLRIDPTSAVDPSRVEQGFSPQLRSEQQALNSAFGFDQLTSVAWLNQLRMQLDMLDFQWTKFVINYSQTQQKNLLKDWLGEHLTIKAALLVIGTLVIVSLTILLLNQLNVPKKKIPRWLDYYQQALGHLAKIGVKKDNSLSDQAYLEKVMRKDRKLGECFEQLLNSFYLLHYKPTSTVDIKARVSQMKRQLAALKAVNVGAS